MLAQARWAKGPISMLFLSMTHWQHSRLSYLCGCLVIAGRAKHKFLPPHHIEHRLEWNHALQGAMARRTISVHLLITSPFLLLRLNCNFTAIKKKHIKQHDAPNKNQTKCYKGLVIIYSHTQLFRWIWPQITSTPFNMASKIITQFDSTLDWKEDLIFCKPGERFYGHSIHTFLFHRILTWRMSGMLMVDMTTLAVRSTRRTPPPLPHRYQAP